MSDQFFCRKLAAKFRKNNDFWCYSESRSACIQCLEANTHFCLYYTPLLTTCLNEIFEINVVRFLVCIIFWEFPSREARFRVRCKVICVRIFTSFQISFFKCVVSFSWLRLLYISAEHPILTFHSFSSIYRK